MCMQLVYIPYIYNYNYDIYVCTVYLPVSVRDLYQKQPKYTSVQIVRFLSPVYVVLL